MVIQFVVPGRPLSQPRPRVTRRGTFNPAAYTEYKREAATHAQVAAYELHDRGTPWDPRRKSYAVRLLFVMPDRRSTDIDKLIATQLDALVLAGVLEDDRYVDRIKVERQIGDDPRCEVEVMG